MASHALMYKAPSSASAAEDMTDLMIWAIVSIAPLFRGTLLFSVRKNGRLRDFEPWSLRGKMHHSERLRSCCLLDR